MNVTTIRASSLPDLLDCPARWEWRNLLGNKRGTSVAAWIGTCLHKGTVLVDKGVGLGDATDEFVASTKSIPEDATFSEDELETYDLEGIGLNLLSAYQTRIAEKLKFTQAEWTLEPLLLEDLGLRLTGTLDRVYETKNGVRGILDIKSGSRVVSTAGSVDVTPHIAQLAIYQLMAERDGLLGEKRHGRAAIVGLNVGKRAPTSRVGMASVLIPDSFLLGDGEDEDERPGLLHFISRMVREGNYHGNPRSMLCNEKYCERFSVCRWRCADA